MNQKTKPEDVTKPKKKPNEWIQKKFEKLGIKTKALWIASDIIASNNLIPGKTQQDVYDLLLIMGKSEREKEFEERCRAQGIEPPKKQSEEPVRRIVMR